MREEIPPAGAVAVVVEPGAEDEVCCDAEEETVPMNFVSRSGLYQG